MWSSRVLLLLCLATPIVGCATPAPIACPARLHGHKLSAIDVFDGPPAEQASLIPTDGGWDLNYKAASGSGFYLNCAYAGTVRTVAIHLPSTVESCRYQTAEKVVCK